MGNRLDQALQASLDRFMAPRPKGDLWVFGYGSLMWAPEFPFAERRSAQLHGYHRSLCIYSHRYRGTPDQPGLVMGLCPGGSCWGVAFRIDRRHAQRVLEELWLREMPGHVYQPRFLRVRLGRRMVSALAFVADRRHGNFTGPLTVGRTARLVARGCGIRGRNLDYLSNTVAHMDELGVREGYLHEVLSRARKACG